MPKMPKNMKNKLFCFDWGRLGGGLGGCLGLFGVVRGGRGGMELAPLSDRVVFHADHDFDIH